MKREYMVRKEVREMKSEKAIMLFLANQNAETTRKVYGWEVRKFFELIGKDDPEKVTIEDLLKVKTDSEHLAPVTQLRRLVVLRQFFRFCVEAGITEQDPTRGVKLPKHTVKAPKPLTKQEAEKLLKAITTKTLTGKRDKAIVTLMLTTGIRLSECLALDTDSINKQGRHWVLEIRGKGNGVETVKLLPKVKRILDDYVKARGGSASPLFVSIRGTRLKSRAVQLRLAEYGEKAGLKRRVRPHDLRHTFARLSHQNGADVLLIQEALRHKSLETTQVYLSRMSRLDKSAFDLMPSLV
jgi:site-specific recombinase XerD